MKKIGLTFLVLIAMVFSISGCSIKFSEMGTEKYYVKIVKDGERKEQYHLNDNNKKVVEYYYEYKDIPAYNKDGQKILVNITTLNDKKLKENAYLKVSVKEPSTEKVNEIQGFEEIDSSKVPEKAMDELK